MRFGINYIQDSPLPEVIEWWRETEELGYEWQGIPDSPILVRELYVCCTAYALNTSRARFSPMVSNPISRHPSVTAGALFSLEELAPGRVALGIGTGDSAIYGIGLQGSKVDRLREYILAVKGLLRGEEVTWEGRTFRAEWRNWEPPRDVPIYVSCHGPKVIRMAAEVADGIISQYGLMPEHLEREQRLIEEGARAGGRDPAEVDLWHHIPVAVGETVDEAFVHSSAGGAYFMARFGMEDKQIPEEYRDAIAALAAEERLELHGRDNRVLAEMANGFGVRDYLIERCGGMIGTLDSLRGAVERLRDRGVRQVLFLPLDEGGNEKMGIARFLAREVLADMAGAPA
jgi:5,10-methylenetetrahydromethanopterin reductase